MAEMGEGNSGPERGQDLSKVTRQRTAQGGSPSRLPGTAQPTGLISRAAATFYLFFPNSQSRGINGSYIFLGEFHSCNCYKITQWEDVATPESLAIIAPRRIGDNLGNSAQARPGQEWLRGSFQKSPLLHQADLRGQKSHIPVKFLQR